MRGQVWFVRLLCPSQGKYPGCCGYITENLLRLYRMKRNCCFEMKTSCHVSILSGKPQMRSSSDAGGLRQLIDRNQSGSLSLNEVLLPDQPLISGILIEAGAVRYAQLISWS